MDTGTVSTSWRRRLPRSALGMSYVQFYVLMDVPSSHQAFWSQAFVVSENSECVVSRRGAQRRRGTDSQPGAIADECEGRVSEWVSE